MCAGTIAITSAATTAPVPLPLHSFVNSATKTVATAAKYAGKNTQTSFNDIFNPIALKTRQRNTAVICIPG